VATGKVTLVGAGPGDPELMTLRGLARLREADLVLHDSLVHPEILAEARPDAEVVLVGKRAGKPSEPQARIHQRMIDAARAGKTVVRLKGGDPFLFGRGSEEAEVLHAAGVAFEVVPGVSSPVAASAYGGFSLTHRELASSVTFLTGTESPDKPESSHDWAKLATASPTLVVFMGLRKLEGLLSTLIAHGRPADTPALAIHWASLPRQRVVEGTVATLAAKVREAELVTPVLLVIGEVVHRREALSWFERKPLFGKRVLVTRPAHQSAAFARRLRDEGAEPSSLPVIRIVPPADRAPLEAAVANAGAYRWVVFTSANGVDAFFGEVDRQGRDARVLGSSRLCAIGPATARRLERYGVHADLLPEEFKGEGVAEALLEQDEAIAGTRVLLPRAEVAREALPDALRAAGVDVDVVGAYRTVGPTLAVAAALRDMIHNGLVDVLTFTSPSTVERLAEVLGEHADVVLEDRFTLASIGPITGAALDARGWPVHVQAAEYTTEGLLTALTAHFASP
jgi:uroporphyrinogen III methyltransferase/synthase